MDATSLQTLAGWADGELLRGDGARSLTQVATDTRKLEPGDLFVALRGESFDGHDFLNQAAALGACGAILDTAFEGELPGGDFAVIRVADTVAALGAIAARYRATLPLRVVGITGSSGKTSTKDFTAAVLSRRYRVLKTEGNFNNHIGLPLTLLRASAADEVGVIEMGMNHPGEIAPLAAIAAPELAIITTIGTAHIEFMGSREAIALEKGRLAEALPAGGALLLNADNPFAGSLATRTRAATLLTGVSADPAVRLRAEILETLFDGTRFRVRDGDDGEGEAVEVSLPVSGVHMVENALLALGAGVLLGVPLAEGAIGLAESRLTRGRLERKTIAGIEFLDDSYNANPDSMQAALRTLAGLPGSGSRIAILGRMGELGTEAERGHRSVGEAAAQAGIDRLIVVGPEARWIAEAAREAGLGDVEEVADPAEAAHRLSTYVRKGDLVLVKGSRAARMERLFTYPAFDPALSN